MQFVVVIVYILHIYITTWDKLNVVTTYLLFFEGPYDSFPIAHEPLIPTYATEYNIILYSKIINPT